MATVECKTCFYSNLDGKIHPCNDCEGYDKWVNRNIYIREASKPLSEAIKATGISTSKDLKPGAAPVPVAILLRVFGHQDFYEDRSILASGICSAHGRAARDRAEE